jgi:hypothetical protein
LASLVADSNERSRRNPHKRRRRIRGRLLAQHYLQPHVHRQTYQAGANTPIISPNFFLLGLALGVPEIGLRDVPHLAGAHDVAAVIHVIRVGHIRLEREGRDAVRAFPLDSNV